jgi:hypothetical protein
MAELKQPLTDAKNRHLIISSIVLTSIAMAYGVMPDRLLPILFDIHIQTVDLMHVFRAMMGLYFGIIGLFILGIRKAEYWVMATLVNVVFMSGLACGRLLSMVVDGWPSPVFRVGLLVEIAFAIWGLSNLKKYKR